MDSANHQLTNTGIVRNYFALAREFQGEQLYNKSEKTLHLALEKLPNHPLILTRLAILYIFLDMPDKAFSTLHRIIEVHSELRYPYFIRGKLFEEQGEWKKAIFNYQEALIDSKRDYNILCRLIPLLIKTNRTEEALEHIHHYRSMMSNPNIFTQWQMEALVNLGKYSEAYDKFRQAIKEKPKSLKLLKRYLQLSIKTSKKSPRELYQILESSIPNLGELTEEEMTDIEVDFLIHHRRYKEALQKIENVLTTKPMDYHWRKRRAFVKLEMGSIEDSAEEFRVIFWQNSTDIEVRQALENHFIKTNKLSHWKQLLHEVLKHNSDQFELFNYLRCLGERKDWLSICELDYTRYMEQVKELSFGKADLGDLTYKKLPAYAFEMFIAQLAIHNRVLSAQELWNLISNEREKKNQVPPFQPEDLEAAYPVWIFVLHLYFLFKSYSKWLTSFSPNLFQNDQVALSIHRNTTSIQLDITPILQNNQEDFENFIQTEFGYRWYWLPNKTEPELTYHGIPFYSVNQFKTILKKLDKLLKEATS